MLGSLQVEEKPNMGVMVRGTHAFCFIGYYFLLPLIFPQTLPGLLHVLADIT